MGCTYCDILAKELDVRKGNVFYDLRKSWVEKGDTHYSLDIGADDYVTKPFNPIRPRHQGNGPDPSQLELLAGGPDRAGAWGPVV